MPFLLRPTCSIHYEDLGPVDAPTVVLLPSLLCDHRMFSHLIEHLKPRYRVLAVDMRGHGQSSTPTRGFSMEDQADDVAALLDDAGVREASFVGLSQGGMTALRAAMYHRSRVRTLVLMDSSASEEGAFVRTKYMLMAASFRAMGMTSLVERAVLPLMFSDVFLRDHSDTVATNVAAWRAMDPLAVYYATQAVAMRTDVTSWLRRIDIPTLVVVGSGDRALPVDRSRKLAEEIPGAELVIIPGAGHLSTIEQPKATTDAVARFLDARVLHAVS